MKTIQLGNSSVGGIHQLCSHVVAGMSLELIFFQLMRLMLVPIPVHSARTPNSRWGQAIDAVAGVVLKAYGQYFGSGIEGLTFQHALPRIRL